MAVADEKGRRIDAATGIVAIVLFAVGFGLPGAPPKAGDTPQQITSFFTDHRGSILAGDFIVAVGVVAFLWFLGSLRSYLHAGEGGGGRLSAAAFGGGVAAVAVQLAAICAFSAGAFKVAALGDDNLNRALYDLASFLGYAPGFGFAVLLGAASCSAARSGALPPWLCWLGGVAAILQLVSMIALFVESGAFAIGGVFVLVAFAFAAVWTIAVSVVLIRRNGVPAVALAAP